MLPTFVIGLREGLEAALIVGIVAAFLRQRGRPDLLRLAMIGVVGAILLCLLAGIGLEVLSKNLPQRGQESVETAVGLVAVGMVTYMVIWMKRHSRDLRGQLETAASAALVSGSGMALVVMAFLAVLREGLETVVFLLAAFNEGSDGSTAGIGTLLGIASATVMGYLIYRGGVKINLSRFFRVTGLVLVLVAAGLVSTALHTAHEAGWLNWGQQQTFDLRTLMRSGSVQSSLFTGVLGIQPRPVVLEILGWIGYFLPLTAYLCWPTGRRIRLQVLSKVSLCAGAGALIGAALLLFTAPKIAGAQRSLRLGAATISLDNNSGTASTITASARSVTTVLGALVGTSAHGGVATREYTATSSTATDQSRPRMISLSQLAALNGGRLPLGAGSGEGSVLRPVVLSNTTTLRWTWWVSPANNGLVDAQQTRSSTTTASVNGQKFAVTSAAPTSVAPEPGLVARAEAASRDAEARRRQLRDVAILLVAALAATLGGAGAGLASRYRRDSGAAIQTGDAALTPEKQVSTATAV